jgi:hypothetical protein
MILDAYKTLGGVHPETAAVNNILAFHGVTAPHTGKPFTEALLLGIGGGLGSMFILWEFEKHDYPSIVLGFRHKDNYPVKFLQGLCARLGGGERIFETTGKVKAADQLEEILAGGNPAIVWLDLGGPPYFFHYMLAGVAVVYGFEGDHVFLDNRAARPYRIPQDLLAEARAKVPSFRSRLMMVEPPGQVDLETAVAAGIRDCVAYLGGSSTSFALPAVRKWARLMTDEKNVKGWPVIFEGGRGLYGTLRTVYEAIEHLGNGGGALRGLYADFLVEAAAVLGRNELKETAALYRELHDLWRGLAQAVLPERVDVFRETRELLDRREALRRELGGEGLEDIRPLSDALHALKGELNDAFPMNGSETAALFAEIRDHLEAIYNAEMGALSSLRSFVSEYN